MLMIQHFLLVQLINWYILTGTLQWAFNWIFKTMLATKSKKFKKSVVVDPMYYLARLPKDSTPNFSNVWTSCWQKIRDENVYEVHPIHPPSWVPPNTVRLANVLLTEPPVNIFGSSAFNSMDKDCEERIPVVLGPRGRLFLGSTLTRPYQLEVL